MKKAGYVTRGILFMWGVLAVLLGFAWVAEQYPPIAGGVVVFGLITALGAGMGLDAYRRNNVK